jgi:hypothetical protein
LASLPERQILKINLAQKLETFSEYWSLRTVAQLNDYDVMAGSAYAGDRADWHAHCVGQKNAAPRKTAERYGCS